MLIYRSISNYNENNCFCMFNNCLFMIVFAYIK